MSSITRHHICSNGKHGDWMGWVGIRRTVELLEIAFVLKLDKRTCLYIQTRMCVPQRCVFYSSSQVQHPELPEDAAAYSFLILRYYSKGAAHASEGIIITTKPHSAESRCDLKKWSA